MINDFDPTKYKVVLYKHCECGKLFNMGSATRKTAEEKILYFIREHHRTDEHIIRMRRKKIEKLIKCQYV